MQILATEHWSLLATRSMIWNEAFSRASMFFTVVSASVVALGLVAQESDFGDNFRLFALLLLPVVLVIGLLTYFRLSGVNYSDVLQVTGMNRLRHAYLELAPELEPYFVTGHHDDFAGLLQTFGRDRIGVAQALASTAFLVSAVDAMVAGMLGGLIVESLDASKAVYVTAGVMAAVLFLGLLLLFTRRELARARQAVAPNFPS
jgi:hypothetical protein